MSTGDVKKGEILSKSFVLGLKISGEIAISSRGVVGDDCKKDQKFRELLGELGLKCKDGDFGGMSQQDKEIFAKFNIPSWINPYYVEKRLGALHGAMCAGVFGLGMKFLLWAVDDKRRGNENERQNMLGLMHDIALPKHFINWMLSLNADDAGECRDALIQYFKHHLENVYECPLCHALVAKDYEECPLCKFNLALKLH